MCHRCHSLTACVTCVTGVTDVTGVTGVTGVTACVTGKLGNNRDKNDSGDSNSNMLDPFLDSLTVLFSANEYCGYMGKILITKPLYEMIDENHFDFFQDEGKFSGHARRKRRRCALVFLGASRTSETFIA